VVPDDVLVVLDPGEIQHLDLDARLLEDGGDLQDPEGHEDALVEQEDRGGDDQTDRAVRLRHAALVRKEGSAI
jgi:hypothetical protein